LQAERLAEPTDHPRHGDRDVACGVGVAGCGRAEQVPELLAEPVEKSLDDRGVPVELRAGELLAQGFDQAHQACWCRHALEAVELGHRNRLGGELTQQGGAFQPQVGDLRVVMVADAAVAGEVPVQGWARGMGAGVAERAGAAEATGVEAEHQREESIGQFALVRGLSVGADVPHQQRRAFDGLDAEVKVVGDVDEVALGRGAQKLLIPISLPLQQEMLHGSL